MESVNAPGQVWDPKKARVQAVIAGYDTPAATRTVSLVVNGKTIATQRVQVPAERPRHRRVSIARRALRLQPLRSEDRFRRLLPADDASLFAVERSDPRRVLFVHESSDRARRFISARR